jgi:hypothetical protein
MEHPEHLQKSGQTPPLFILDTIPINRSAIERQVQVMSMIGIENTLTGMARHIFDVFKEGVDLPPNATPAEIDKFSKDLETAGEDASRESIRQAESEVKEHVIKHLMAGGTMTEGEADKWFLSYWKHVQHGALMAEKFRRHNTLMRWLEPIKWWGKAAGMVLLWLGGFALLIRLDGGGSSGSVPSIQTQTVNSIQQQMNQPSQIQSTTLITNQFNSMIKGIQSAPSLPSSSSIEATPAIPDALAAVEAEPVTVELETPDGTQQIKTTVREFYKAAPAEVRQEMEAPKVDHGYDHEDPNDCSHRHCLTPHKDFTISADFDSGGVQHAHVHY